MTAAATMCRLARVLETLDAHDPNTMVPLLARLHPDVEWDTTEATVDGDVYRGPQEVVDFFHGYIAPWQHWEWRADRIWSFGVQVLVEATEWGVSRQGVPVEKRHFEVWTFDGPRVRMWQVFNDRSQALSVVREGAYA